MSLLDRVLQAGGNGNVSDLPTALRLVLEQLVLANESLSALIDQGAPTVEMEEQPYGPFGGTSSGTVGSTFAMPVSARCKYITFSSDTSFIGGLRVSNAIVVPFAMLAYQSVTLQLGEKGLYIPRGAGVSLDISAATSANVTGVLWGVPVVAPGA